ncbi:MAG: hypothetical protein SGARI_001673 [Bacillariaceae sp.]
MIAISVKTNLKDKLGTLCQIDPASLSMEEVLSKIQEDLNLDDDADTFSLIRLMPNGKKMHSMVRKPSLLTDTDYYLVKLNNEDSDEESSDEEADNEYERRYSTPVARRTGKVTKVTPVSKKKANAKKVTPVAKKRTNVKTQRHKAVASVAKATAAFSRNRRTAAAKRAAGFAEPKPRKARYQTTKEPLSDAQRQKLAGIKLDLQKFTDYLYEVEGITTANVNIVVRQVTKLHEGQGIEYKHWKRGVIFRPGYVLRLDDDFLAMRDEAVAFQKKHGSHPVRKVENYQKHLLENLSKVPAPKAFTSKKPALYAAAAAPVDAAVIRTKISHDLALADPESDSDPESDAASEAEAESNLIF